MKLNITSRYCGSCVEVRSNDLAASCFESMACSPVVRPSPYLYIEDEIAGVDKTIPRKHSLTISIGIIPSGFSDVIGHGSLLDRDGRGSRNGLSESKRTIGSVCYVDRIASGGC